MKPRTKLTQCLLLIAAVLFVSIQDSEAGRLRRVFYEQIGGGWITNMFGTNLSGTIIFPDSPGFVPDYMPPQQGIGSVSPPYTAVTVTNYSDNYGSYIQGYFTAPESGVYRFHLCSDDESQWWMNTDSTDPLNRTKTNLLAWVPGWAAANEWTKFPEQTSAEVTLEAGKSYYLEIYHKEGTGGDHIQLGWTLPSGQVQRPMPSFHFQPAKDTRWGEPEVEAIVGPLNPNPGEFAIYDGMETVVYANVNLDPPVTYTWFKNDAPYPAAQGAYHTFRANIADNNSRWKVQVTSGGQTFTSMEAYMTVSPDTTKPTIALAGTAPYNPTAIQVVYSEAVNPQQATNIANYTLTGATIQSARMSADGKTVFLGLSSMITLEGLYTLTVNNQQDFATPANVMDPVSLTLTPGDGALSFRVWTASPATDLGTLRSWSATNSTTPSYTLEQFNVQTFPTISSVWEPGYDNYAGQMVGWITAPETGDYQFAIAADDHAILYLGTNHLASTKREIATIDGYTGRYEHNKYPTQKSGMIRLEKGYRYYIEGVFRDGTGGDGVTILWRKPGAADWPTTTAEADLVPYRLDPPLMTPKVTFAAVSIKTNLPATLSAAANTRPVVSVTPDGYIPWNYQWYKDDVAISGATAATYQFPFLTLDDNGAKIKVVITNNFSSVTSAVMTLNVYEDTTRPTVVSAGSALKQKIDVFFSEPINMTTAVNPANYKLYTSAGTPVAITSVTEGAYGSNVVITTAAMPDYNTMRIEITGVQDLADLVVAPSTNLFTAFNFDELIRVNNSQNFSAVGAGDQITLVAGGADIWGQNDGMAYLYRNVSGNFDVKMRVDSLDRADNWTKLGIMVRATADANSQNYAMLATPTTGQNQFSAQSRDTTGADTRSSGDGGSTLTYNVNPTFAAARPTIASWPKWIRLQRIGNVIYYHYSNDGINWTWYTHFDTTPFGFPDSVMLGVALTSHTTGNTAAGKFSEYGPVSDPTITITQQPGNASTVEGGTATFNVAASGLTPLYYQWLKGTTPIPDGTNATLVMNRVALADNNAAISVRVTNPYNATGVTSASGTLSVTADTNFPTVVFWSGTSAKIQTHPTEVKLLFSEPVNRADAENVGNYAISVQSSGTPLAISSASLAADDRTVTLTTSAPHTAGTIYKVVVNNVKDLDSPAKTIAANTTETYYYAGVSMAGRHLQRADGYVIIEGENFSSSVPAVISGGGNSTTFEWVFGNTAPGYSGRGYVYVPNNPAWRAADVNVSGALGLGAYIEYEFTTTAAAQNYTLWVRGWNQNTANSGADDQVHVALGIDGAGATLIAETRDPSSLGGYGAGGWDWRSDRVSGTPADPMVITNLPPGTHKLGFWHRDDGFLLDKIVIEPGVRSGVGNSSEPSVASANSQLGQTDTQDWIVAPPAAPTITLVSPTNNQVFAANSTIPLEASVVEVSPVSRVEFRYGNTVIGMATTAPYTFNWANAPEGLYPVVARVIDSVGYVVNSGTANITVDSSKPVPYAIGSLRGNGIGVYFSDLSGIDPTTATNVANYVVNGGAVAVTGARLEPDNRAVTLTLDQQISGPFSVQIKDVADRGFGPNVVDTVTLNSTVQNTFVSRDVGTITNATLMQFSDPILPGIAHTIGTDALYMRAGGSDIWNNQDGIHFAYTEITGDFDITTRVYGLSRPDNWTKAGLMVREDLDGNSRTYNLVTTATNGQNQVVAQWRATKGGGSSNTAKSGGTFMPNTWLRVTRTNQTFTSLFSTNGVDWASFHNMTMTPDYPSKVYVGLALTSHNNGTSPANQASAYFDNITGFQFGAVVPQPMLAAKIEGANLVLTWNSSANFKVQQADSLQGTWTDAAITPVQSGNSYTATIPVGAGSKFFRLVTP